MSLLAAAIERVGIPTVSIVYLKEAAERIHSTRALWVPSAHGYALGAPNDVPLQLDVLRQALRLLGSPGPGPVLADYVPPHPVQDEGTR